jgi:hypothetical protein
MFCSPVGINPNQSGQINGAFNNDRLPRLFGPSEGQLQYSSTGAPQPVTFDGLYSNDTQDLVTLDSSTPTAVSLQAPSGWTGYDLSGTLEHLSTEFRPLKNGLLDNYHSERYIISGSPWNSEEFYIPDEWSISKSGDATSHPTHGGLYWFEAAGSGREGSMGWRPSVLISSGTPLSPSMELYLSQELHLPWRDAYSCEVRFYHRVPSAQVMNDIFYLYVEVGTYREKFNVFSSGYVTDEWIVGVVDIPASVFSLVPGVTTLDIGLSTDFLGNAPSNINNRVFIDEIDVIFEARPFPEQIGLSANQSAISSLSSGSISPYVPDGAARDCFSRSDTGISTSSALEVGVWSSSGTTWNDIIKYQIGIQFPLDITQGAIITYAALEAEALGYFGGGDNSLRVLVAQEDNVSPFTNGLPNLENRYSWSQTSVAWVQDSWENGYRYRTPDMSSLVQGVVSRSGWNSGNYICLMIDYMNSDQYRDWNSIKGTWGYGGDDLPTLYVDYMIPQEEDTISVLEYSKDLTIDHTMVSADLENFPVLVDIYDSDLKTDAQPDGDDIKFMIGSETLDYELEVFDQNFNSSHAHLVAWVHVPSLSSTTDTTISMCYGSDSATRTEDASSVWGDLYDSVWHFSESSGNGSFIEDSSGRTTDAMPMSTAYTQNGVICGGRRLQDAVGNYIPVLEGDEIFDGWSDWYMSFWLYIDYATDAELEVIEPRILYKGGSMRMARLFRFNGWPAGTANFQVDVDFFTATTRYHNVGVRRLEWNFIVMKYESSGDGALHLYNYIDGALYDSTIDSSVGTGDRLADDPSDFLIGDDSSTVISGIFDEFRISSDSYRSMAWIETEYQNQYDPSSFLSVGKEQTDQYIFSYKKDMTVDHTKVSTDLQGFPLLINIYDTNLRTGVQSDGDDIMFRSGDTWLPHEIELFNQTYNSTHAHLIAWVKLDLSSSVDTPVTMHYGNPYAVNNEDPKRVWSDKYKGVWHLGETSGAARDSAVWGTDGTVLGGPTRGFAGQVGYSYDFDGSDDYIFLGSANVQSTGTYSLWMYPHSVSGETNIIASDAYLNRIAIYNGRFRPETATESEYFDFSTSSIAVDTWQHVVFVRAGDFGDLYINGAWIEQVEVVGADTITVDSIGGTIDIARMFSGPIDEVRISSTTRSAEWIATEYANQFDPSSFLIVGTEEEVQYGQNSTLLFTTDTSSYVSMLPRLTMKVESLTTTLNDDMLPGTLFSVVNGTEVTWTAHVLVSPPTGITDASIALGHPISWSLQNVTDPLGTDRTAEASTTATEVLLDSSAINANGKWSFVFTSINEVSNLECSAGGSPYDITAIAQSGQTMDFRGTASIIPGSAMRLKLVDPDGQIFYTSDDLTQDGSGQFEWTGIAVDSSWKCGLWIAHIDFNDTLLNMRHH